MRTSCGLRINNLSDLYICPGIQFTQQTGPDARYRYLAFRQAKYSTGISSFGHALCLVILPSQQWAEARLHHESPETHGEC